MIADSTSLEGQFLVAMPAMGDTRFERTVIYVCAHSGEGAMGFVINKPLAEPSIGDFFDRLQIVSERERAAMANNIETARLRSGGPVEPGRGFVLHSGDYQSESTLRVDDNVSLTATLEILRELAMGRGPRHYFLALGYSGWSGGQLEDEIGANGWLVAPADAGLIYDGEDDTKYHRVMHRMGINPSLLSQETGHA